MHKTIGQAFDDSVNTAFPNDDIGYPQTASCLRVANIMVFVCEAVRSEGFNITAYNFYDTGKRIFYNIRCDEGDSFWVAARWMERKELDHSSDAALISDTTKWLLANLRGEIMVYELDED